MLHEKITVSSDNLKNKSNKGLIKICKLLDFRHYIRVQVFISKLTLKQ